MRIFLLFSLCIFVCAGCAYVSVENKYIPSKQQRDYVNVSEMSPDDVSFELQFKSLNIFADLSLYSTDYSGLKIIGAEISRDADSKEDRREFALRFGVGNRVENSHVVFIPEELIFVFHGKEGGVIRLEPEYSYRVENSRVCPFDYGPSGWGLNGMKIDNKIEVSYNDNAPSQYVCFNFVYSMDYKQDGYFELSLENAFPSVDVDSIYFDKVKVKRIRSN